MTGAVSVFDQRAEDYDRWFDSPVGKKLFRVEVEAVRFLMRGIERPFLEVGVGTGRFAKALGIDLGIDPSAKELEIAESRGVRVLQRGAEALPFGNESFGAVFILFTFCFVADPAAVLSEAKRVLKRNGALIVGMINKESPWGQLYETKKAQGHPIYQEARFYRIEEAESLIAGSGLKIDRYSSALCLPPSDQPHDEIAYDRLVENAGFVCIRAIKSQGV